MAEKIVIIGGVAGGASAAARLRRLDEQAEIVVFERTGYMSYANCGLPYYIGGVIRDEADLTLQTPESFYARFRINVRVRQEVTSIDRAAKTVSVRPLDGGSPYTEHYDKLILSPGARPVHRTSWMPCSSARCAAACTRGRTRCVSARRRCPQEAARP